MRYLALNTAETRNRNLAAVFDAIRENEGRSRSEIGGGMPFSLQTMTNVTQELIDLGLVAEGEHREAASTGRSRGNPPRGLRIVAERGHVVGVQFRWNALSLVLVDLAQNLVARQYVPMSADPRDAAGYLAALEAAVAAFVALHGPRGIWGLAVAGPLGLPDASMPNMNIEMQRRWKDQVWFMSLWSSITVEHLRARLESRFGLPVMLLNNVQAAAIAEAHHLPTSSRFIYLLAGLGLTGAFVTDRALSADVWRHGGELGHVVAGGQPISSVLSASGLRARLGMDQPQGDMDQPVSQLLADHPERFDGWLDEAAALLRFLVNFLENALWPDGMVVGGFLPLPLIDRLLERVQPLTDSVVRAESDPLRRVPRLARARTGIEAMPVGAALAMLNLRSNPNFPHLFSALRQRG